MNKKLTAVLLAGALSVSLMSCGDSGSTSAPAPEASGSAAGSVATNITLTEAIAEQPVLLTSAGQSADYSMVGTVIGNIGIEYTSNAVATSADLGDHKTLVVAVGGSSKGLGAAGVDADGELARLAELMDAAVAAEVTIIVTHTGGATRRGELSDKFVAPTFAYADYAIVVSSGDEDGLMAGICADAGIPMDSVESIADVVTVLPAAFK